jgi:hypothetical protein
VPAGLTLTSNFGFYFQCQVGSSLVLRRPIETTAFIRQVTDELYGSEGVLYCTARRSLEEHSNKNEKKKT